MMRLELNIQLFAASATITNARQGNYSIENNNEVQRLTFTVKRTSGSTYWQDKKTLTFRLTYTNDDGTTTTLTQTTQFNFPSGSVGATKSTYVDFTVPHKTDGTQNITYEASIATGTSVGTLHSTGSATLETIPRASSITVNDANIGSATNIVINKASANFTTTLYYKASGQSNWTKIVDKTSNQVYGWTVPTSFYSLIPNSKTISCQFYAETYNGSTLIGTSSTVTATFTATGNPVINSVFLVDINSTTVALTGDSSKMIRYASNVRATISASAQNSASISSIKVNGTTASSGVVTFNTASTNSFQVVVTDSRGYTTTQTKTMTMINYVPLTLNATIARNQPTDGIVNINYNGNYFNGSFGSQSNSLTVEYRSVEKGQDITQTTWQPLNPTKNGNTYSQSNYQISGFDYRKQYEFQIRSHDKINTVLIVGILIKKGQPVYWWNDDGIYLGNGKSINTIINNLLNDTLYSDNANNYNRNSMFYFGSNTNSNVPANWSHILTMGNGGNDISQIASSVASNRMYWRRCNSGSWSSWKTLAFTDEIPTNNNQLTNGRGFTTFDGTSGSNSNGSWIKFTDGTMICYYDSGTTEQSIAANSITDNSMTFPQTFISNPLVITQMNSNSSSANMGYVSHSAINTTTTGFTFRWFNKDTSARSPRYGYVAYGKWK